MPSYAKANLVGKDRSNSEELTLAICPIDSLFQDLVQVKNLYIVIWLCH